jgi:putative spermidine/putrescine transport system ATP-binding protein
VAYPLRIRGASAAEQSNRVKELLTLVRLPGFADRSVAQLSGGQRQRVAIARALALSPRLFLLDEPLSALDAKLREAMQVELRELQRRLGITTIVVTHDQREAMTMADLIVVMGEGRIRQSGPPVEIYRNPCDTFVADFIGTTNLLRVTAAGDGRVTVPGGFIAGLTLPEGVREATLSVRPEDVQVVPAHEATSRGEAMTGRVIFVRDLGASIQTYVEVGGVQIVSVATARERPELAPGAAVGLVVPAQRCVLLRS